MLTLFPSFVNINDLFLQNHIYFWLFCYFPFPFSISMTDLVFLFFQLKFFGAERLVTSYCYIWAYTATVCFSGGTSCYCHALYLKQPFDNITSK